MRVNPCMLAEALCVLALTCYSVCNASGQDGSLQNKEMHASAQDLSARPFLLQSIDAEKTVCASVEKTFLVLDSYEYERVFGNKPRARDPRCSQIQLPDIDGQMQNFFVFTDPSQPHRKLTIGSTLGESSRQELMGQQQHLHRTQGDSILASKSSARLEGSKVSALLDRRLTHNLCSLVDFQASQKQ
eukprot:6492583-Amphidinium_carterae.5